MNFSERLQKHIFTKYLHKDEELVTIIRNHWVKIIPTLAYDFIVWFITPAILISLNFYANFAFIAFPIGLLFIVYHWFDWYGDGWIITNNGIIEVEWNGIFEHSSLRINYYDIESVSYEKRTIANAVFNYGIIRMVRLSQKENVLTHATKAEDGQTLILKLKRLSDHPPGDKQGVDTLQNNIKDLIDEIRSDRVNQPAEDKKATAQDIQKDTGFLAHSIDTITPIEEEY